MKHIWLLALAPLLAAADWYRPSALPLYSSVEPLRWEIRAPGLPQVNQDTQGTLHVHTGPISVKLSPRGNARREMCEEVPPFKIKLPKSGLEGTIFAGADNSIHYVTHCRNSAEYIERLHLEYSVYRMLFESGLPASMVRLTHARYTSDSGSLTEAPGMIPEHLKDTARRLGVGPDTAARSYDLVMAEIRLALLFVQNADANITMEHNVWALRNAKEELVAYVAYDFDLTNLVNPEFFKNKDNDWSDDWRLEEIARAYGKDLVSGLLREMNARRPAIQASIDASPASSAGRARLTARVESFFSTAARLGLL